MVLVFPKICMTLRLISWIAASMATLRPIAARIKSSVFPVFMTDYSLIVEPLIGHGKIKIAPCIKSCAQDDLMITRK